MSEPCCSSPNNDELFTAERGERVARRYRRKGLLRGEHDTIDPVLALGVQGATVLEIGGGVGQLQLALLDAGASRAVNLELSPHYEQAATALACDAGHAEVIERRLGDAAHLETPLPRSDVALLHRVVCCTDDWRGMVDAALATEPGTVAITLPRGGRFPRLVAAFEDLLHRLRGNTFRVRLPPPASVLEHLRAAGYELHHERRRPFWLTLVVTR